MQFRARQKLNAREGIIGKLVGEERGERKLAASDTHVVDNGDRQ